MHVEAAVRPGGTSTGPLVALLGNPNVGKSVIFSLLTRRYVTVSNYPGTTIEVARGTATFDTGKVTLVDTPGINTLLPTSEDERVARDILLEDRPRTVLQVADAKNLGRALLLTLQLAEMQVPMVLDLNMHDEALSRGIAIDVQALQEMLGVEVVRTVATRRQGVERLKRALTQARPVRFAFQYSADIERAVEQIVPLLPEDGLARRSLALMLLAGDASLRDWLLARVGREEVDRIETIRRALQGRYMEPLAMAINAQRQRRVDAILRQVMKRGKGGGLAADRALGALAMHPLWGIPFLAAVLFLLYEFVGILGAGTLVNLLEKGLFGRFINPGVTWIVGALLPAAGGIGGLVRDLLVGEYGIITMGLTYAIAIVLPIVGTFFLAFGVLEDSGYLPRLAIMANRLFRAMGLNGKAILPMVLGLGCDTMATLTTRILETRKERVITTLLLALGVPCSAQLGVILGMLGGLSWMGSAIWVGAVLGVLFLVGYLAARVLPGERADFVLEIPPIRVPQLSNIAIKTMARMEWYLREAVPLFLIGTVILFVAHRVGLLGLLERGASPLVQGFLGLPAKATEAFIVGFLRRDYGAAGLFVLARQGALDGVQIVVSLVTITLFIPCVANLLIMIKERGLGMALGMVAFIFPFAFGVGGALNALLRGLGVRL